MEFFQNNLEIILAIPKLFLYNVSAWAKIPVTLKTTHPGIAHPCALSHKGGQRGMIGVEDKTKGDF
jgi:hypothetical protein